MEPIFFLTPLSVSDIERPRSWKGARVRSQTKQTNAELRSLRWSTAPTSPLAWSGALYLGVPEKLVRANSSEALPLPLFSV